MIEDLPGEEWLGLPWLRGYEVSSLGRVRTYRRRGNSGEFAAKPRLLWNFAPARGYRNIRLVQNGKVTTVSVHTLVLEAFVGPRPAGMVCRHLNGDRNDCRVSNLCWGTQSQNAIDKIHHGTSVAKLTPTDVRRIRSLSKSGMSHRTIAKSYGVSPSTIDFAVSGHTWSHVV